MKKLRRPFPPDDDEGPRCQLFETPTILAMILLFLLMILLHFLPNPAPH